MNSTEREIYDKYAYKKTHIYLVYEEFERRVNNTNNEYEGLKKGECRFDYSSWEKRLNLTHKVLINSIKILIKESYIEQRIKGKKGTQSTYFLTRFLEQNLEQNREQNLERNKVSNNKGLYDIKEQKEEQNREQKKVQSSIYNNLNIKSNINNIYSPLKNELCYEEENKSLEKDLLKQANKGLNIKNKTDVKKDKYSEESKEYQLSVLLRDLILERDKNSRCKNADMQKWSKDIDLLHRKDSRSYEEIEKIIRWCQQDSFWRTNILSTHKLREKFDSLYQRAFYENKSFNNNNFKNNNLERSNEIDDECWYFKDGLYL